MILKIDEDIKNLKERWKSWAEKRCAGINQSYITDEYYRFAAISCISAIQKLLKKEKNGEEKN